MQRCGSCDAGDAVVVSGCGFYHVYLVFENLHFEYVHSHVVGRHLLHVNPVVLQCFFIDCIR